MLGSSIFPSHASAWIQLPLRWLQTSTHTWSVKSVMYRVSKPTERQYRPNKFAHSPQRPFLVSKSLRAELYRGNVVVWRSPHVGHLYTKKLHMYVVGAKVELNKILFCSGKVNEDVQRSCNHGNSFYLRSTRPASPCRSSSVVGPLIPQLVVLVSPQITQQGLLTHVITSTLK